MDWWKVIGIGCTFVTGLATYHVFKRSYEGQELEWWLPLLPGIVAAGILKPWESEKTTVTRI